MSSPKVYAMNYGELKEWVKTKAQIGDIAYCYDPILKHSYVYCYHKPDDNPFWIMIQPKTDIDILDAKMISIDLAQEYPCAKCIHCKPCEEAYDMDLGDNYQYCPYYNDGKTHEKEIQKYRDFLESLIDYLKWDNYPTSINVQDEIKAFLKRMDESND